MFAEKVRKLLKKKGLSQTQLACILGTSQQVVSRWLTKDRPPKPPYLAKLAAALEVSVDYLLGDPSPVAAPTGGKTLEPDEEYVLQVYRSLKVDPAQRLDGDEAVRRLSFPPDRRVEVAGPGAMPGQSAAERERAEAARAEEERASRKNGSK